MEKILFVVSSWNNGGVESYISNVIPYLKEKYLFNILAIRGVSKNSIFTEKVEKCNTKINQIEIDDNTNSLIKIGERIKKIIEYIEKENYSIVHINCTTSDFLLFAYAIKKKFPKMKIIIHCHGDNIEPPHKIIKVFFHNIIKHLIPNSFDYAIGCSERTLTWMFPNKIIKKIPHKVVYCGIDLEKFKFSTTNRNEIRKKILVEDNTLLIGTVGRICEQKNPFFILKILKKLKEENVNYKFLWVGEGNLFEKVKQQAVKMGIDKNIIFYGKSKEVEKIYSALDIFILPSIYEGNPIVGLEAQANGIKCLFSNKIVNEAKITNYVEFLPINKEKVWSEKIIEINNDYKRKNMTEELAQKEKDMESCIKQLEKIYQEVIERG